MERLVVIRIWDEVLGYIEFDESTQELCFIYDCLFVKRGIQVSPIIEPLSKSAYRLSMNTNMGVYAFFPAFMREILPNDIKLPDKCTKFPYGRKITTNEIKDIFSKITINGLGAISFELFPFTDCGRKSSNNKKSKESIKLSYNKEMNSHQDTSLLPLLNKGTYRKALILYNKCTGNIKPENDCENQGYEHYILKFNDTDEALSDWAIAPYLSLVEYSYYKMAIDCGIYMMHSELISLNSKRCFITKRYDRIGSNKIHCLSFCHIAGYPNNPQSASYDDIFSTLTILNAPYDDFEQVFRRLVFNIIGRNTDDSTQNFSFTMSHDGAWRIAPAYDLCYAYNPNGLYTAHHQMQINGKTQDFLIDDIITIAIQNGIKSPLEIISKITSVFLNIDYYLDDRIPLEIKQVIKNNLIILT